MADNVSESPRFLQVGCLRMRFEQPEHQTKRVSALPKPASPELGNVEEGNMDKLRRWSKNARLSIHRCDRRNTEDVVWQLERYLDELRIQAGIRWGFGGWKAIQETVKSHLPELSALISAAGSNKLARAYRICEEIMSIYATVTMKMIAITFESEDVQTQQSYSLLRGTCNRLVNMLTDTFRWSDVNIFNSLLKMTYDKKSMACMMLVGKVFHTVLFTLPITDTDDISLCASYILFCKYKKFIPAHEHDLKTEMFLQRYMRDRSQLDEIQMLKDIVGGGCGLQDINRVVSAYFRYLKQHPEVTRVGDNEDGAEGVFGARTVIYLKPPPPPLPKESTVYKTEVEEPPPKVEDVGIPILKEETRPELGSTKYTFEFGYETPPSEQGEPNFFMDVAKEAKCLDPALLSPEPDAECGSLASSLNAPSANCALFCFEQHEDFKLAQKSILPYSSNNNTTMRVPCITKMSNITVPRISYVNLDMDIDKAFEQVKMTKRKRERTVEKCVEAKDVDNTESVSNEACLPLKKRRRTAVEEEHVANYPATPMISIAELAVIPRCGLADTAASSSYKHHFQPSSLYRSTPPTAYIERTQHR